MTQTAQNGKNGQGSETAKLENVPTVKQVKEWMEKDLQVAITMLNAIQTDPDLKNQMAIFLHGRWLNMLNQKKISEQAQPVE